MKMNTGLGREIDEALDELRALYGRELLDWFAGLWDEETGSFYYSNSARDYEGFLPDIESLHQALKTIRGSGALDEYGGDPLKALPADMAKKMSDFICSLEDEDGYFYHPQWGKDIGTSRRGRDLTWATSNIKRLGGTLPYPSALEQMRVGGATKGTPDMLRSKEAFLEYLDRLDIESHSHNKGHNLCSQSDQIRAAGLGDVMLDYLDVLQEKVQNDLRAKGEAPNGLWQQGRNYVTTSGLFKLGVMYNQQKRPMKYLYEQIDSAIEAILSDEPPKMIIYVYNPWCGLSTTIGNMKICNELTPGAYDLDAVYKIVRARAPEMIRKTAEKLKQFQKPDHAFSYYDDHSAAYTQGTHVGLGIAEGDVNGTSLAVHDLRNCVAHALGLSSLPIWTAEDLQYMINKARAKAPTVKKPLPEQYKNDPPIK